jgi:hypothetical protein
MFIDHSSALAALGEVVRGNHAGIDCIGVQVVRLLLYDVVVSPTSRY